jgi:hypothetical protein
MVLLLTQVNDPLNQFTQQTARKTVSINATTPRSMSRGLVKFKVEPGGFEHSCV